MRALAAFLLVLAAGIASAADTPKKPLPWAELTAEQQQTLAPLKPGWESMDLERRRKWLGIAKRYPSMQPAEQERVVRRMETWAKLTPEQRRAARERYLSLGRLPAERRQDLSQQWAEYQSLSPAEKRKFEEAPPQARGKRKARSAGRLQGAESPATPAKR